jgi:rubredoxin
MRCSSCDALFTPRTPNEQTEILAHIIEEVDGMWITHARTLAEAIVTHPAANQLFHY